MKHLKKFIIIQIMKMIGSYFKNIDIIYFDILYISNIELYLMNKNIIVLYNL